MIFVYLIPVIVIIITNIEVIKEVNRFVFETRFSFYLIVYFKDSSTRKSIEQKFQWTISTSTISYWTSCNAHCYFYHWYFEKRNSIIIYLFFSGGFLIAWTPYAITVAIRLFVDETSFPPILATIPAILAKTSVVLVILYIHFCWSQNDDAIFRHV